MSARRVPRVGDVFAVRASWSDGVLGRVVSTSAVVGPTHGCSLVYVYRPGRPIERDELLTAPLLTSRAPWSRGYFEVVRSEPLLPADYFELHAFRDVQGALYDEESRPLTAEVAREPIGEWRLYEDVAALDARLEAAFDSFHREGRSPRT